MSNPIAVLISDVHYSVQTLDVASQATNQAIAKANELKVPLISAGDLHDTKANIRGECIKVMLDDFSKCTIPAIILVGNHDKINEKSEGHSLEFLRHIATIVSHPVKNLIPYWAFIPYQHNPDSMREILNTMKPETSIIMHQGIVGSNSGEYIQDKSAINHEDVADFRVISGHYHQRQDIKCGRPRKGAVGLFSYIGNPYTLNFAEANDPEKGFQILYDDGLMEFVPTNLRKHKVFESNINDLADESVFSIEPNDILWIKLHGSSENLSKLNKKIVTYNYGIKQDFRLDLIPVESKTTLTEENVANCTQPELLDDLIDSMTNLENDQKARLKSLWKNLCE